MVETVSAMIFTIPVQSLFSLTVVMYSSVYIVQNLKISNFGSLTSGRFASQSIYYFIFRLLPLSCICVTQISESCCVMFTMKTDIFQCNLAFVFFCHVAQGEGFCQAFSRDTQGPRLRVRV